MFGLVIHEHEKEVAKMLEKIGQLVDDYRFSERDTKLCLMKSVVKLVMFWKKMLQTGLPNIKYLY
jgi:hypothetical protein